MTFWGYTPFILQLVLLKNCHVVHLCEKQGCAQKFGSGGGIWPDDMATMTHNLKRVKMQI